MMRFLVTVTAEHIKLGLLLIAGRFALTAAHHDDDGKYNKNRKQKQHNGTHNGQENVNVNAKMQPVKAITNTAEARTTRVALVAQQANVGFFTASLFAQVPQTVSTFDADELLIRGSNTIFRVKW